MRQWIGLTLCASCLVSSSLVADDSDLTAKFQGILDPIFPGVTISSVNPSPVDGLYEVTIDAAVIYMSEDGAYLFRGDMFDLGSRVNLTEGVRTSRKAAMLAAVPASEYIEFRPDGAVAATLYVFTDVDCTFCRQLHKEMSELNAGGIAVRYLAYPRTGIDSESYHTAVSVWCSDDPHTAITRAKADQKVAQATCDNPVATQFQLGQEIGITGTPAVFLENGRQIGGYVPAADLVQEFGR